MMPRILLIFALILAYAGPGDAQQPAATPFPLSPGSVRFAVIGDAGTGEQPQAEVASTMAQVRLTFPFSFVLMVGDNLYGRKRAVDYERKFERPYKALLDAGVRFYAALGNHDSDGQRSYGNFHMNGARYYTFAEGNVRFFALDSTGMDAAQLAWIDRELGQAREAWKICFFHHPLYSSGKRHGSDLRLRELLEPLFIKHGVRVCFAGHDHVYERLRPQRGIHYFVTGAAGSLRKGNLRASSETAAGFDRDRHFMAVEVASDTLYFKAVSRTGEIVDSGSFTRSRDSGAGLAEHPAPASFSLHLPGNSTILW